MDLAPKLPKMIRKNKETDKNDKTDRANFLHGKVDQVGKPAMNFVKIVKMVMQIFISRMASGGKEEEKY